MLPLVTTAESESRLHEDPLRTPEAIYNRFMERRAPASDEFDAHVVASLLAISLCEAAAEGKSLVASVGLEARELLSLIAQFFPDAGTIFALPDTGDVVERSADEVCLMDLLQKCATVHSLLKGWLAAMIARRAQRPNHLWQDLGLRNRGELSLLMMRHFKPLAIRNTHDMKWKKFLYRIICSDANYRLCTAPSCSECDDFEHCFGEETGESLLARARRNFETGR